jgi:predicted acyltransferase (DUF342 family)
LVFSVQPIQAHGRAEEARPILEKVRDFYAHPLVIKRRQEVEELLRRCEEVRT